MYMGKDVRARGTASGGHEGCMQSMNGEAGHAYSNGIAKVDIQGVLEFVRGREDFVELVRRHMGDDCAQLVRELSQDMKAAEDKAFYDGFCYCFQRIEKELGGDERIAGALRKARQKVDRKYIRGDAWDDSFAVERMAALERRYQESIEEMQRNHQAEITRLESVIAHQAEQVKEMAVYKARAEAAEGAAMAALCYDFADYVYGGGAGSADEYRANRSAKCVDKCGRCFIVRKYCRWLCPTEAKKWMERAIQEG